MVDSDNVAKMAEYGSFAVGSESDGYPITVGDYALSEHPGLRVRDSLSAMNGFRFSTADTDRDGVESKNCAGKRQSPGW